MASNPQPIQYIEVTSTNRNRVLYPNPSSFDMDISQSGIKNNMNAYDPISNASALKYWNLSFLNNASGNIVAITGITVGVGGQSDIKTLQIVTAQGELRTELNYYDGSVISVLVGATQCYRRIIWYEFLSSSGAGDIALVWIDTVLPNGALVSGTLTDPTSATNVSPNPQLFLPTGEDVDNFYINYFVQNINLNQTARVIKYDGITHMLTLEGPTASNWQTAVVPYNFVLRKALPSFISTFFSSQGANIFSLYPLAVNSDNIYTGSYLRMIQALPVAPYSTPIAPFGENTRITRYRALSTTISAFDVFLLTVTFTSGVQEDNYYLNCLVENIGNGDTYFVTNYVGETRVATVAAIALPAAVGEQLEIRTAFTTGFSVVPLPIGVTGYELLQFTTDNAGQYNYFGSMVSQQEGVCYEIELLNLVLPNILLNTARGGRIVFYPYVYVALHNAQTQYASRNVLWSNNPSATRMLFRATVNDTSSPLITPFIRITGNGMKQTVKFKPNDNIHFSVHLPDGSLFSVEEPEMYAPNSPNPLIQISAVFGVRRV